MFAVSDLRRAAAFYREVLGLRCTVESDEFQWAEFDCGNVTLALKGGDLPAGAAGGGRLALAVEDVAQAYAELVARGVRVGGPPEDSGFCVAFEACDPDGNRLILHRRADGSAG
jgi:predicted enzyme related to lactoylglutathione lyase